MTTYPGLHMPSTALSTSASISNARVEVSGGGSSARNADDTTSSAIRGGEGVVRHRGRGLEQRDGQQADGAERPLRAGGAGDGHRDDREVDREDREPSEEQQPVGPEPELAADEDRRRLRQVRHRGAERREGDEALARIGGTRLDVGRHGSRSATTGVPSRQHVRGVRRRVAQLLEDHVARDARAAEALCADLLRQEGAGGDLVRPVEVRGFVDAREVRHHAGEVHAHHGSEHEERRQRVAEQPTRTAPARRRGNLGCDGGFGDRHAS